MILPGKVRRNYEANRRTDTASAADERGMLNGQGRPELARLRPGVMKSNFPMPVTGADYKWMNLIAKAPHKAFPRIVKRLIQGPAGC